MSHLSARRFKYAILVMLVALTAHSAFAADRCDAILAGGVFDSVDVLDLRVRHKLVSEITCDSKLNVNLDEKSLSSSDFCSKRYEEALLLDRYVQSVRRASDTIAGAWVECLRLKRGLRQYFTTASDPSRFVYTVFTITPVQEVLRSRDGQWPRPRTTQAR